jgi:PAS domain S-box-containing protein
MNPTPPTLRQRAEAAYQLRPQPPEATPETLHELEVHQIELEMQNEELRRTQTELDAARARYFDLYDLAPVGYLTVSEAGVVLEANLTATTLLGAAPGALVHRPFSQFIHKEDQDAYYLLRRQLLATGQPQTGEVRLLKKDRPPFWAELVATLVQEDDVPPVCRVVLSDISARKRTEAILAARARLAAFALTHSLEELLRATLDEAEALTGSVIGFYHFLEADQQTLSLQAWSTNTGQKMCRAEGEGRHYPVDQAGVWVDCIRERRAVIHNNYAALPHRKGLPPGHASVVRQLVVPVLRGDLIVAILGVGNKPTDYTAEDTAAIVSLADLAWEIAERKRAEAALAASQTRYRQIVETTVEGVWLVDAAWKTTFVNARMEQMLGCQPGAMLGHPFHDFMDEAGRQRAATLAERREQGIKEAHDFKFRRQDGTMLWAIVSTNPILNERGEFAGALAMVTDITERKQAETTQTFLARTSSGTPAEPFFRALARYLAQDLGMDFVCIDRLEGDGLNARTVAVWCDGKFEDDVTYALKDTPCGDVVGKTVCCFPASVCQFFPRDQVLQDLRAESYLGVTLWSHRGQPIGLIALISRRPLTNRAPAEATLKLVAERAAGELERLAAEAALQEKLSELERMNRLMVGRENRMIELKQELNDLSRRLNLPPRYAAPENISHESKP